MLRRLKDLVKDRRGGTAIEYGLILSLIVIAMMAALVNVANTTISMWTNVSTKVQNAN